MAIASLADLGSAAYQRVSIIKNGLSLTNNSYADLINKGGSPGAGTLAGTSTTTGVVPTDADAGFPAIAGFGGTTGYLVQIEHNNVQTGGTAIRLFDVLWKGGAYAFNAAVTGQTPTSYASRLPGTDYNLCEIWAVMVTAGTGVQNVAVEYTNGSGTTGRVTPTTALRSTEANVMTRIPLAGGDRGLRGITGVTGTVATAGTFNLMVLRRLAQIQPVPNISNFSGWNHFLLPQVFEDSALMMAPYANNSTLDIFTEITIANG